MDQLIQMPQPSVLCYAKHETESVRHQQLKVYAVHLVCSYQRLHGKMIGHKLLHVGLGDRQCLRRAIKWWGALIRCARRCASVSILEKHIPGL